MAVRNINEAKVNKKFRFSFVKAFVYSVFAALILVGGAQIVRYGAEYLDYENKITAINAEIAEIEAENADKELILVDEDKQAEYFEHKLREDYGYCKSGEKVFYISSYSE